MALTQGAWAPQNIKNSKFQLWKCNVAFTTAENDAYTLATPSTLDPSKQWTLMVKPAATADGSALPLEIYVGFDSSFAISGDGVTVAATNGALFKTVVDDVSAATMRSIVFDPNQQVADVTAIATGGMKVKVPIAPYYAFNLNGASTLNATNCDFYIMQYTHE